MKNKFKTINILLAIVMAISFTSCEDITSEGISTGSVYYPVFEIQGSELNYVAQGANFTVPTVKVLDGPNDITDQATVTGTIDLNTPGYYEKVYTATTGDGYTSSFSVKVFVFHPDYKEADVAGTYNGLLATIGGGPVTVKQAEKGVYSCDDFFAGYYNVYKGYGSAYVAKGFLIYIGGNKFIIRANSVWGPVVDLNEATYDPATGIITYGLNNDGYTWNNLPFTLTPVVE